MPIEIAILLLVGAGGIALGHTLSKQERMAGLARRQAFRMRNKNTISRDSDTASYECVWDALSNTETEAEILRTKSMIARRVEQHVSSWGVSEAHAARRLGLTVSRMRELKNQPVSQFTLEQLIEIATACGFSVVLQQNASRPLDMGDAERGRAQEERRAQLKAADQINSREGLPPPSNYAVEIGERYISGELTADEAVSRLVNHHTSNGDRA